MQEQFGFSKGERGRILPPEPEPHGKVRIAIRIDADIVDAFLREAEAYGGSVAHRTLIHDAFHQHREGKAPKLEETLRRSLREELCAASG